MVAHVALTTLYMYFVESTRDIAQPQNSSFTFSVPSQNMHSQLPAQLGDLHIRPACCPLTETVIVVLD